MAYYEEDEVARLITNLAKWNGDGESIRGCGGLWGRILREEFMSSFPVVTLGIDAGRAKAAMALLARQGDGLAKALWTFHRSSLTFVMQARELGMSRSTYHRRLEVAHVSFMEVYRDVCKDAVQAARDRDRNLAAHRSLGSADLPLKFARESDEDYKKP